MELDFSTTAHVFSPFLLTTGMTEARRERKKANWSDYTNL